MSLGLKAAQCGEYKEARMHFPENLVTEAVRLSPEDSGQQSKRQCQKSPENSDLIQDGIETKGIFWSGWMGL